LEALCVAFANEPVALYAGGAASFVQRGEDRRTASREQIKGAIQRGDIRLACATDAACEGLISPRGIEVDTSSMEHFFPLYDRAKSCAELAPMEP
jgi:hypothetical protein